MAPKAKTPSQPANSPPQAAGPSSPAGGTPRPKTFRDLTAQDRTLWESFLVLPARTRLRISLAVTAFAVVGIIVSDQLEKMMPPPPKGTERLSERVAKGAPPP